MTLQTDLQQAVTRVQTDSQILHQIVHGSDQTIVTTEGGGVKTVAKAIHDIEENIQSSLTDLGANAAQLQQAVQIAEDHRDDAANFATQALNSANALNLPTNLAGHAGQLLAVKQDESGYEPIDSKGVFYGLKKNGAKLIAETGQGTFIASDYLTWFITLPGISFSINPNGHLSINL